LIAKLLDEREEERAVPRTGQQISALPDDGREGRAACQQAAHLKEKNAHAAEERPGARFNAQAPIKEEAPRGARSGDALPRGGRFISAGRAPAFFV
jgi:hypothetical protein